MFEDTSRFFARSNYHKPDVLNRIANDITLLCSMFRFSCRVTQWGCTQQLKLCIYGGLPISVSDNTERCPRDKNDLIKKQIVLPIQIWLTQLFPVDPPLLYTFSSEPSCRVLSNHKYVDVTGRCHTPELAEWKPATSTLWAVIGGFKELLEEEDISPFCIDRNFFNVLSLQQSPSTATLEEADVEGSGQDLGECSQCVICFGSRDIVLVPCGHYCLCVSCASNLSQCPLCREVIKFRQRVFS